MRGAAPTWGAACMLAGLVVVPATAQAAPPPAQSQVVPQTREELDVQSRLGLSPSRQTQVQIEDKTERAPCPFADAGFAQTRVTFSKVVFPNLKAVDPAILDDSWREYAGTEQPVAVLCEVRDRAATALRAMGYLAAVQIPPQRIEKMGEARMDVLIAHLAEVQVRGEPGANARAIADHLAKLTQDPYFNANVAERQLLLLDDMPGYQVRLTLKPAKGKPGEVIGDVRVKRTPFELFAGVQNLGPKSTGRESLFVQAQLNGLTGLADQTTLSLFTTADFVEQTVVQAAHEFGIGSEGLRLKGSVLYGRSKPTSALDIRSETEIAQIGLTYPFKRSRAFSLLAGGGIELVNQDITFGSIPLARDRLRVFYAKLAFSATDSASINGRGGYTGAEPQRRLIASLELRQGADALGASKSCTPVANCLSPNVAISNALADPSGFVVRGEASIEYRPVPLVTVAVAPRFQYSPDELLSYERFSVGNYSIGRGLDPGSLLGDSGVGSSVELRLGRLSRGTGQTLALQPFLFLDAAWTWTHDGLPGQEAYSIGTGVRGRLYDRVFAGLNLAVPLNDAGTAQKAGDVRLLFTLSARLHPGDPK